MKMSKFTEAQIAFALKQAELGTKVEHNANGKEVRLQCRFAATAVVHISSTVD